MGEQLSECRYTFLIHVLNVVQNTHYVMIIQWTELHLFPNMDT